MILSHRFVCSAVWEYLSTLVGSILYICASMSNSKMGISGLYSVAGLSLQLETVREWWAWRCTVVLRGDACTSNRGRT